ncbi:MAG TPA: hypothetical protein VGN52_03685 [Burkholderiales bacterium]
MLNDIAVDVPADVAGAEKDTKLTLLSLFYTCRDSLTAGVTNSINVNPVTKFLYFNVCPKLQVHGLAINEPISGVTYRRSALSPLGQEVLARMDKATTLSKAAKKSGQINENANGKPEQQAKTEVVSGENSKSVAGKKKTSSGATSKNGE